MIINTAIKLQKYCKFGFKDWIIIFVKLRRRC